MSSLAAQLAGIRANNNATILDKSKRKKVHSVSLVFDSKEAVTQDFETIYYACLEGFRELETIDKRFSIFANSLFSETSIRFDRMVQHDDRENALNAAINKFLMLVANYLHLRPALLALEWLVRRFHIQLHNAEQLLLCALPWYDTQEFVRVLDVIPQNGFPALFSFLGPAKAALHSPSKNSLVRVLSKDSQLAALLNSYVVECVGNEMAYSRQLVFWSSMSIWTIMTFKERNDPEIVDRVLPVVSRLLVSSLAAPQTAAYMVLTVLCSQYPLADDISEAAISTIVNHWLKSTTSQALSCISQLVRYSSTADQPFSLSIWNKLEKVENLTQQIITLGKSHQITLFIVKWAVSGLEYAQDDHVANLNRVLDLDVEPRALTLILEALLSSIKKNQLSPESLEAAVEIIEKNIEADAFKAALAASALTVDKVELHLGVSLSRPVANEVDEDVVMEEAPVEEELAGPDLESVIEESVNLEMSSRQSYLDGEPFTERAELWIKASAFPNLASADLAQIARVSPHAEPSFFAAMALGPYPVVSRIAAAKLLQERIASTESQDFQGLLVALLSLLSNSDRSIRENAAASIRFMGEHPPAKNTPLWGYESLYGTQNSSELVWLSRSDQKSVYKFLLAHLDECVLDHEQIVALSSTLINKSAAFSELLAVHAVLSPMIPIIHFALSAMSNRKVKTPVAGLTPLFERYLAERDSVWAARATAARISLFDVDTAVCGSVVGGDETGVQFLQSALRSSSEEVARAAGQRVLALWNGGQLKENVENSLLTLLITIAADDRIVYDPTELLSNLQLKTENFIVMLGQSQLQASTTAATAEVRRRHRRSSASLSLAPSTVAAVVQSHLHRLTLVLELLDSKSNDIDEPNLLFGPLFSLLDELAVLGTESNLPVLYTQELLATCLLHLVEKVNASVSAGGAIPDTSSVRVDVIVSCIRTSQSPQVQNRLLLLVAALASLCPDIVLHSVMPIFTFMGATTVRLDNDYSAHVIEQTISKVVPALVACGDKQNEIEIALLSFVAAFPHVPRHRRNKLYGALIKTLGPEEALYKLLLLLALKFGEGRNRKRSSDAKALVHFTVTFLRSYPISQQLSSLAQFLEYVSRAKLREENSDSSTSAVENGNGSTPPSLFGQDGLSPQMKPYLYEFLTLSVGNDQTISGTRPLRVQVAQAGDFSEENLQHCTRMIDLLLDNQTDPVSRAASFDLLSNCLELLPIDKFVEVVTPLVRSASNTLVKERALSLIASKFEYELAADESAQSAALATLNILEENLGASTSLLSETLDDFDLLVVKYGRYFQPERLLKLLDVLAGPYGLLNDDIHVLVSAVCCVNSVCQHLGARMIGHFSRILPVLFSKCEHVIQENSTDEKAVMLQWATFALVSGLIQRIPSFMGSVSKRVLELVFMSKIDLEPRENLVALIVEKVDPQTVLGAFISTWDNAAQGGMVAVDLFLRQLDVAVEQSAKKDIAAKSSPLVTLLLRCFAVRALGRFNPNEVNHIESRVVSSGVAVVLKLNDKVFRPLFVRMARWAFEGESAGVASMAEPLRHVVFLKFLVKLLGDLKSIVTNYFGYVLDPICQILAQEDDEGYGVYDLTRKLIYQAFVLSFASDNDDFWQSPSRFDKVLDSLLVKLDQPRVIHGALLVKALVGLAETCSSQQHRKKINDGLAARVAPACSSSTKIWAIKTLSSLYTKLGEEWISVLPQFVPLIAELLDDDDETVEMEVRRKLVPVIEDVLGESLDKYLS